MTHPELRSYRVWFKLNYLVVSFPEDAEMRGCNYTDVGALTAEDAVTQAKVLIERWCFEATMKEYQEPQRGMPRTYQFEKIIKIEPLAWLTWREGETMNDIISKHQYSIEYRAGNYYLFENQLPRGFWTPDEFLTVCRMVCDVNSRKSVIPIVLPELHIREQNNAPQS